MKGKFYKYSLICVHAPIEDKEDYENDYFYDNLEKVYDECPKFDIKICLGDINAKVGKKEDAMLGIDQKSLHADRNNNEKLLISSAESQRMVIEEQYYNIKIYTKLHGDPLIAILRTK
jgi:hypothetical protein